MNRNGEYDIINNKYSAPAPEQHKPKRRPNSMDESVNPYISNLNKEKDNPKSRKQLNLISEFDNLNNNKNFKFTKKDDPKEYHKETIRNIKSSLDNRLNEAKKTRVDKVLEQTSSLFNREFYDHSIAGKIQKILK